MSRRNIQTSFFKKSEMAYGGDLLKKRKGRRGGRPLSTSHSIHLVLRSTKAVKDWSFKTSKNRYHVERILNKFSLKYGVRILSSANVGNHIHLHIRLASRHTYRPFIRAITSAIAMSITGVSRWNPNALAVRSTDKKQPCFWDRRPFTRVIIGRRGYLNVSDYVLINQFEGLGRTRDQARFYVGWRNAERDMYNGKYWHTG